MNRRERLAPRARWRRWPRTPILLPIFLQVLGGLLAFVAAGGVLERDAAAAALGPAARSELLPPAPASTGDRPDEPADPRDESSETGSGETDDDPPASSPGAGSVPAGVKLAQSPWPEPSRSAAGSRTAAHRVAVPVSGLWHHADRLASLSLLVASSPLGGSLSPLSPRGPPQ